MSLVIKDLGPCSVLWDPTPGANLELNPVFGGVTFKYEETFVDIKEDGHGETPVDSVPTGNITELTIAMTRSTLAQLVAVIKGGAVTGSTLKVSNVVGGAVFANAKEIIIKPLVNNVPSVTETEWLHIHRAYPFPSLEWVWDNAGQRITNVVFKAYPNDAAGYVGGMWRVGAHTG